ncbi:hypothetical protein RN001_005200 [Aquatica leii]|uniref:Uncharacterized protein n=1 Tax=Aquatica leii TaxID=1421715 RepID=A0AAN7SAG4_9COLE|nr:hypothetical protein RN001_005200 [Aquatica leii]
MSYNRNDGNRNWLLTAGVVGALAAGVGYYLAKSNVQLSQSPNRQPKSKDNSTDNSNSLDYDFDREQCNEERNISNSCCRKPINN